MATVTLVGSFNVDHVWRCEQLPAAGATIAGRYDTGPGGKGFNQAVAAARAGAQVRFLCALGDDAGGALARGLAQAEGVELRAQASNEPTGTAGIYVDAMGRNSIVIGAGANGELAGDFVAAQGDAVQSAKVVLVQLESPVDTVLATLRLAREHGVLTVLNPAPANAHTTAELLDHADFLTPNETEFAALLARHVGERLEPDDVAALDGQRLHAFCRDVHPKGTVVITLGSTGVFVSHVEDQLRGDGKHFYRHPAESVTAIDTTGAGDAFNGALVASLAHAPQAAFAEHVRYANRFAALSTERAGAALAMPSQADVIARFGE